MDRSDWGVHRGCGRFDSAGALAAFAKNCEPPCENPHFARGTLLQRLYAALQHSVKEALDVIVSGDLDILQSRELLASQLAEVLRVNCRPRPRLRIDIAYQLLPAANFRKTGKALKAAKGGFPSARGPALAFRASLAGIRPRGR